MKRDDDPMPSQKVRPPRSCDTAAASMASSAGERVVAATTATPRSSVLVRAATAPSREPIPPTMTTTSEFSSQVTSSGCPWPP